MPVRCQDCNHHFLLDGTTVVNGIGCPECGGKTIERDQPSPTQSDGELRNMVDPATQLDQGGNPLQEGVWAGVDGGWQPAHKRDEFFANHRPSPVMSSHDPRFYLSMEPHMPWTHEAPKESSTKEGFAFLAPLAGMAGRMLLARALPSLMGRAVRGLGNNAQSAPQQEFLGERPLNAVAAEHTAVGINAPVETPGSVPDMVEDHDPEAVDQQEFNDGDMSPAFNNPNLDDADAGMARSMGEDGVNQKLEFRHDGDGVSHAELLLPLIMEYVNSDKSALDNPQLKALHDVLDQEIPDYIQHASDDDPSFHEFMEAIQKPQGVEARTAAPVYMTTPMNPGQMQMGPQQQQLPMPGTHQNPVGPGGMSVQGRCANCGSVTNADGSCPQCGASAGVNQQGNLEPGSQHLQTPGIMPSPYAHTAADHQGPITPQQKEVFAEYLIQQGRNDEVAAMMANPGIYADEWSQFLNRGTQPPEVDPNEQPAPPQPQMDPSQMGQMPVPGMSMPQPTGKVATMGRCPKCQSATTSPLNPDGEARCHRCGHIWKLENVVKEKISNWRIVSYQDEGPNPIAAPAADVTAPGDREQQADSSLTWQSADGQPLQVGQVYEMHSNESPIPDMVKVEAVKPDSLMVTMVGEYNAPSDPQDPNGPEYAHEIPITDIAQAGLTFNPVQTDSDAEQSQDQNQQDGIGQTVNTEPVEQPHDSFPTHSHIQAKIAEFQHTPTAALVEELRAMIPTADPHTAQQLQQIVESFGRQPELPGQLDTAVGIQPQASLPTDRCPKCDYGHVTSSYLSPELVQYECYRCANSWTVAEDNEGSDLNPQSREWLQRDDDSDPIGFDPRALAMATTGKTRNIRDIAKRDPRLREIHDRLNANKTAGAKFSPSQQKVFIDEDGVARNADLLNLDGTHYVSAFDNTKARPDKVNDSYLGLGL